MTCDSSSAAETSDEDWVGDEGGVTWQQMCNMGIMGIIWIMFYDFTATSQKKKNIQMVVSGVAIPKLFYFELCSETIISCTLQ